MAGTVRQDGNEFGAAAHVLSGPVNDGQWHHFVLTRNAGNQIQLFVDGGASTGRSTASHAGGSITTDLRGLGLDRYLLQHPIAIYQAHFVGAIDDFRIYGVELSADDVRALAARP
jgi:hypothetical protein